MGKQVLVASPRSGNSIDNIALGIVEKYQPEMLINPQQFDAQRFLECELENLTEIAYDYRELQFNVQGYTDIEEMECVICSSYVDDPMHERFLRSTIAHELGHCFLHVSEFRRRKNLARFIHNDDTVTLKRLSEDNIPLYANPEWQAWRFAGALLIPKPSLDLALSRGATKEELCNIFGVNPAFLNSRLRALKML
jgi:Zn-dependent peptidase ImmA (M78 family)